MTRRLFVLLWMFSPLVAQTNPTAEFESLRKREQIARNQIAKLKPELVKKKADLEVAKSRFDSLIVEQNTADSLREAVDEPKTPVVKPEVGPESLVVESAMLASDKKEEKKGSLSPGKEPLKNALQPISKLKINSENSGENIVNSIQPAAVPKKAAPIQRADLSPKKAVGNKATAYTLYRVLVGREGPETLWSIAAKPEVLGDGRRWKEILEANRDIIADSHRIYPGMQLKIPNVSSATGD